MPVGAIRQRWNSDEFSCVKQRKLGDPLARAACQAAELYFAAKSMPDLRARDADRTGTPGILRDRSEAKAEPMTVARPKTQPSDEVRMPQDRFEIQFELLVSSSGHAEQSAWKLPPPEASHRPDLQSALDQRPPHASN